jgi:hypothetical protein
MHWHLLLHMWGKLLLWCESMGTLRAFRLQYHYCCPTSTPAPQPTNTPGGGFGGVSSTPRPPTATPAPCTSTSECLQYCGSIPNCSAACINGYCVFTNPTINNSQCNTWGNWSGCISGQGACGGCAAQGYTCQTRSCTDPSNANLYQISCGCSQPPGGGGANPTNTPAPTALPNPYWLKLKGASFRGLSSIPFGLVSLPSCLRAFVVVTFVSSCLRGEKRINHQDTKAQSFSSPLVHWRSSGRPESLPYGGLLSAVHPAVCRLRSAVSIRLFVPHSLTVCSPWQAGKPALRRSAVCRPFRRLPSAVRGLHSFIRSPIR